jgi:hypothetical protein
MNVRNNGGKAQKQRDLSMEVIAPTKRMQPLSPKLRGIVKIINFDPL